MPALGPRLDAALFPRPIRSHDAAGKQMPVPGLGVTSRFKQKKAGGHLLSPVRSIIGAGELDFRVRNGNGYFLPAMATGILCQKTCPGRDAGDARAALRLRVTETIYAKQL